MTLTELRYIVALAQEQHFGRAAERCHVSQPTLSIAVKKLEEELGVLFERGKTRILPTPLGGKIVAMAAKVLEQAAEGPGLLQAREPALPVEERAAPRDDASRAGGVEHERERAGPQPVAGLEDSDEATPRGREATGQRLGQVGPGVTPDDTGPCLP